MSNTLPVTYPAITSPTVEQLLLLGRSALLDPNEGPVCAPPVGQGNDRLQSVRIVGATTTNDGQQVGTYGWTPGDDGWPFLLLKAYRTTKSYHTTYRATEDWLTSATLGLCANPDGGTTDYDAWAHLWDAVLTKWFALHRGFNAPVISGVSDRGDCYWQYEEALDVGATVRLGAVAVWGSVMRLRVHNDFAITWGV